MSKSRDIADSAATINYIDGLTSDAQGQLNDKATLDGSPTFTGTVTATAFSGDGSGLTGVDSLPSQTGNNGLFLTTNGSTASWAEAGGGAWNLVETINVSSANSIDVEGFTGYERYKIIVELSASTSGDISARLKLGGTYKTDSLYRYYFSSLQTNSGVYSGSSATNLIRLTNDTQPLGAGIPVSMEIDITKPTSNIIQQIMTRTYYVRNTNFPLMLDSIGCYSTANVLTGIRLFSNTGLLTGKIYVYGLSGSEV